MTEYEQRDLFRGNDRVRHDDPDTSHDAAAQVGAQRANYIALLRALDFANDTGLTDYQAADAALERYGAHGLREAVRRRMGELRTKGWAEWMRDGYTGAVVRDGRRGVSIITEAGKGELADG